MHVRSVEQAHSFRNWNLFYPKCCSVLQAFIILLWSFFQTHFPSVVAQLIQMSFNCISLMSSIAFVIVFTGQLSHWNHFRQSHKYFAVQIMWVSTNNVLPTKTTSFLNFLFFILIYRIFFHSPFAKLHFITLFPFIIAFAL